LAVRFVARVRSTRTSSTSLEHYRSVAPPGGRCRLVVAGDFVDFVGMTVNDGVATYTNLGSWAEEEGDERDAVHQTYRAARTHRQIHDGEEGPVAELFAWDRDRGRNHSWPGPHNRRDTWVIAPASARQARRS